MESQIRQRPAVGRRLGTGRQPRIQADVVQALVLDADNLQALQLPIASRAVLWIVLALT